MNNVSDFRLNQQWDDLRSALWFMPAVMSILFAILAVVMLAIDYWLWDHGSALSGSSIFRGGVDGSRGVLTAIAGSLISAAAVVFSITVVTLQLASSQFTPRLLRRFTGDRQFQLALGLLLGTFVYCLIALWSVGSKSSEGRTFVPTLTTAGSIILGIVSVAVLILFLHRVSSLIQVSVLVNEVTGETLSLVRRTYESLDVEQIELSAAPEFPSEPGAVVHAPKAGYLRAIDGPDLLRLAEKHLSTIVLMHRKGDFLLKGMAVASVHPADEFGEDFAQQIQSTLVIGSDRSSVEDVVLGIRQIGDIALKALSPGINDPTTAMLCIDSLSEILVEVATRRAPSTIEQSESGGMVILREAPPFDLLVDQAFTQIRHYGASDVIVAEHLAQQLGQVAKISPVDKGVPLREQANLLVAQSCGSAQVAQDCQRVQGAASWATVAS